MGSKGSGLLTRRWATCALPALDAARAAAPAFTIMQFNCLADGLAQHGDFVAVPPAVLEWPGRWALISEEIAAVAPDVLCVQEMNHPEQLALSLPTHAMVWVPKLHSPALRSGAPPDGTGLLVRREMFDILEVQTVYYRDADGAISNQNGIVCGLRDRRTRRGLVVAATHLKAKGDAEVEALRQRQISELLGHAKRARTAVAAAVAVSDGDAVAGHCSHVPVLLCGDFNSSPTENVYATVYGDADLCFRSAYNRAECAAASGDCSSHAGSGVAGAGTAAAAAAPAAVAAVARSRPPYTEYAAGEPEFTTAKFGTGGAKKRTIDYVWVAGLASSAAGAADPSAAPAAGAKLALQAVWELPSEADIGPAWLPSAHYPSDHLALAARLAWV